MAAAIKNTLNIKFREVSSVKAFPSSLQMYSTTKTIF